jgi:hypothetical protein
MNQMNTIIKYANDIINKAPSETKTWTTSFHDKLIKSITKMSMQETNLCTKIIMDEIFYKEFETFSSNSNYTKFVQSFGIKI